MVLKNKRFRLKRPPKPSGNFAFIDSQNLNLGVQRAGWKMDWKKFRQFLSDEFKVQKAYMFIGYVPDNEDLYQQMKEAGYLVVLKPTVDMLMSEEELAADDHVTKGNADAELVMYAVKEMKNYKKAVIVSGDGDFFSLVEYLKKQGQFERLLVPNSHYSSLYNTVRSDIINLDTHRRGLVYEYTKRRGGSGSGGKNRSRSSKNNSSKNSSNKNSGSKNNRSNSSSSKNNSKSQNNQRNNRQR